MVYVLSSSVVNKDSRIFLLFRFLYKVYFLRNYGKCKRCIAMYRELNLLYFNKIMTDSDYSMT